MKTLTILFAETTLLVASAVGATTRYVSPNGSGSTFSHAVPGNFSDAVWYSVSGDTIIMEDGTYYMHYDLQKSGLTVRAENKWAAVWDAGGSSDAGNPVLYIRA